MASAAAVSATGRSVRTFESQPLPPAPASVPAASDLVPPIRHASRRLVRELGLLRPTLAGTDLSPAAVHYLVELGGHVGGVVEIGGSTAAATTASEAETVVAVQATPLAHLHDALAPLESQRVDDAVAELRQAGLAEEVVVVGEASTAGAAAPLALTPRGRATLAAVDGFAREQVLAALEAAAARGRQPPQGRSDAQRIEEALRVYAEALRACRLGSGSGSGIVVTPRVSLPSNAATVTPQPQPPPVVRVLAGYQTGFLGRVLSMHMAYYSRPPVLWGASFEAELAKGFGDLVLRVQQHTDGEAAASEGGGEGEGEGGRKRSRVSQIWAAVEEGSDGGGDEGLGEEGGVARQGRIVGSIMIDGEDLNGLQQERDPADGASRPQMPYPPRKAHLRGFIMSDHLRGRGVGKRLLGESMDFVRRVGFAEAHLWTLRGLDAAVKLYEAAGFSLVDEGEKNMWGQQVVVKHYRWVRGTD